jgi:hypothetical protein
MVERPRLLEIDKADTAAIGLGPTKICVDSLRRRRQISLAAAAGIVGRIYGGRNRTALDKGDLYLRP